MKKLISFMLLFFLFPNISAICEQGQIDINSASLEDLDKLTGIGPSKAQSIIEGRSFDSIDDLIQVYGIGPATLEKIKAQNLACVKDSKEIIQKLDGINNSDEEESQISITTHATALHEFKF